MRSEARVVITNPTGLHARPAVRMAQLAAGFEAEIEVRLGDEGEWIRARSTARLMKLKAVAQSVIHFRAEGVQAGDAVSALVDFVRRDFDEEPVATGTDATRVAAPQPVGEPEFKSSGETRIPAQIASTGIAAGRLCVSSHRHSAGRVAHDRETERRDFDAAIATAASQLHSLVTGADQLSAEVIQFQINLLDDEDFLAPVRQRIGGGEAADAAWTAHLDAEIGDYETAQTAYLRDRAADLRDLEERVMTALAPDAATEDSVADGTILVVDEMTPSKFLQTDWQRVVAVAAFRGSPNTHAAMLARARGVAMLVDIRIDPDDVKNGAPAIVDAESGLLILRPESRTREHYDRRVEQARAIAEEAERHAGKTARTIAGEVVRVLVNIDSPSLVDEIDPNRCDGVGLTRTEFLFQGRDELPDEEIQFDFYRRLLTWAQGKPVTIRTLDAGGDKPVAGVTLDGESNPFLGLRGVRLSLRHKDVFRVQLRALARAAIHGTLKVMVPMITFPRELDEVRALLREVIDELDAAGVPTKRPALGMMVEVPAAALAIEAFDADFFSIGTNDLAQYVLAAGRDNASTAALLDPLHPGIIELIARVAKHGADTGKEVSVCGETAARADCIEALVGAGIRTLSVPPASIATVKAAIASI